MNIGNLDVGINVDTKGLTNGLKSAGEKVSNTNKLFGGFVITLSDVMNVAGKVANVLISVVNAAGESELIIRQLADAMKSQNIYSDKALKTNLDYAVSLSQITKYTDEQITSAMKLLTNFGLHDEQLRQVTASTLDLATRTGSLDSAAVLLGKAFQGETGRLAQVGIQIDDTIPKSQRFVEVMKQVRNNFGGTAQGEANTYLGSMQQMKNEFGELAEVIGNPLIPRMTEFNKNIKTLTISLKEELPQAIDGVKSSFKVLTESAAVKPFLDMFKKLADLSSKTAISINGDNKSIVKTAENSSNEIIKDAQKQSNAEIQLAERTSKENLKIRQEMDKKILLWQRDRTQELIGDDLTWRKAFINTTRLMKDSLANAFTSMTLDGKNFGDTMGEIWEILKRAIVQILATMLAQYLVNLAVMQTATISFGAIATAIFTAIGVAAGAIGAALLAVLAPIAIVVAAVAALIAIIDALNIKLPTLSELADKLSFKLELPTLGDLSDQLSFKLFANGVRDFQGGLAVVGEQGPELVNLPRGSSVYTNQESKGMLKGSFKNNFNINIVANVRSDEDWDKVTRNKIIPSLERYMKKTYESPFA